MGFKYLVSKPQLLFYTIFNTALGLMYGTKYLLWPLIIYSISESDTITGSVFATMGVIAFLLLALSRYWADSLDPYKMYFIAYGFLGPSGLVVGISNTLLYSWVAIGMYAVGEAIVGPTQNRILINNVETEIRGRVLAADDSIDKLLATIAPLFAAYMLTFTSAKTVWLIYVFYGAVSAAAALLLYRKTLQNR